MCISSYLILITTLWINAFQESGWDHTGSWRPSGLRTETVLEDAWDSLIYSWGKRKKLYIPKVRSGTGEKGTSMKEMGYCLLFPLYKGGAVSRASFRESDRRIGQELQ
ncbi:uncharacterized protein LOC143643374 [Tamandua tetradactyla]|uniref:uncharacterized protein LOC143643374 n=1 Tax=Tamandua tetradactyla TaxID=48850 RepID=UPI0040539EB5